MIFKYFWILTLTPIATAYHRLESKQLLSVNQKQEENIALNLNQSVKPCDDFYAFACGSYDEHNRNNNYQEITSQMDHQYNLQILNLMDTVCQQDYQVADKCQTFTEKTRIYLKSCRTQKKREIQKYFEEFKPGQQLNWPMWDQQQQWLSDEINNIFDVWDLLGRMQAHGLNNVLLNQEILVHPNGSLSIMLEPAYLEENTTLPDLMITKLFLMNMGAIKPKKILKNLQLLNEKLLEILAQYEDSNENLELEYQYLDEHFPQLHLKKFLAALLQRELPANTLILIRKHKYFQHLNDNLWQLFQHQDMCNYLMMKFLFYLAFESVPEFTALECIKDLRRKMDVAVNYLYLSYSIGKEITEITEDIRKIQNEILKEYSYSFHENHLNLTSAQVSLLLEKLMAVTLNIGNLPKDANKDVIEKYYENLPPLDKNNYFKNHLYLLQHRFQKSIHYSGNQTHYIVPDNKLGSSSGALYVSKQNMILLNLASLQMPFYHINYDDLKKYSLLALVLAHEYTHAFDTTGLYFDTYGSLSSELSSILDHPNFQSSIECLQTQLATESIDERLSDIVASRIVYNIFNIREDSKDQLWQKDFYLNMAQFFCGKKNLEFVDHDTDADRLNQIVMNSPEFATAFNCPLDSNMNPKVKCRIY